MIAGWVGCVRVTQNSCLQNFSRDGPLKETRLAATYRPELPGRSRLARHLGQGVDEVDDVDITEPHAALKVSRVRPRAESPAGVLVLRLQIYRCRSRF
jgi:hypothetical protein